MISLLFRALPATLLVAVGACTTTSNPRLDRIEDCAGDYDDSPGELVTLDAAGGFSADGEPLFPRGVNSYPLLQHAGDGNDRFIEEIFETARRVGRPLMRTLAFDDEGERPSRIRDADGSLRETGLHALDKVVFLARKHEVRLVLVLSNQWPDYGGAPAVLRQVAPGEALPTDAFYSDARAIEAQRSYIDALARRNNAIDDVPYASDPTIFAWEITNEAECRDPRYCNARTLVDWANVMTTTLRDAGVRQLVAWGGSGTDDDGTTLAGLAEGTDLDVLTLHLYPQLRGGLSFGAGPSASDVAHGITWGQDHIERAARVASRARKGLLVEELGWRPSGGRDADGERAIVLGSWLRTARRLHVGSLPWMIGETGRQDFDGFLIRAFDDLATTEALACE